MNAGPDQTFDQTLGFYDEVTRALAIIGNRLADSG
jgi:hypothetical protein